MSIETAKKWVKTTGLAILGGGIAGAFSAMWDPNKYSILHDLGSGKLWKYFGMGAALTFGGMLLHSPLGQKVVGSIKESQEQLKRTQEELKDTKAQLKAATQNGDKP